MILPNLKLKNKLALFNAISKAVIIILLIILIPWLVSKVSINDTDKGLEKKLDQVIYLIDSLGIENFIDNESEFKSFGSYNILKDEYILIEQQKNDTIYNTIEYSQRIIEDELVDYRVLSYSISENDVLYLIEIGKSIETIIEFERRLKNFALLFIVIILGITVLIDLSFIQLLLHPFEQIVGRLKNTNHPSSFDYTQVNTSTSDFKYLDETINLLMHKIEDAFNNEREYISNVSHELLTPISIIQSKLDNILSIENLSDSDHLKIMDSRHTLGRLTKMVRTLLMMSRIENEEYFLTEKVNLNSIVNNVAEEIEDKILAKELELKLELNINIPIIEGNENLLFILIYNLVNNAIRYTQKGYIKIETTLIDQQIVLKVSDTGMGISAENLPQIFSRFKNFNNHKDSFGLGLALAKKICDYHKIEINVTSEINVGTTFILTFKTQ